MAEVTISEFTDPGCPFAYSAEPVRQRLQWLYGDALAWRPRMVVLSESPEDYERKGFTPEGQAASMERIAAEHGMPIDARPRPRMAATRPACEAVIAAGLRAPDRQRALLRALRVRSFAGELLDDPATLSGAAQDAGLDPPALVEWAHEEDVQAALQDDMAAARAPIPAARVLDEKLADSSGGRRYTCPTYEMVRDQDGARVVVPGFQPAPVYEVMLANLLPYTGRRSTPESVEEVLTWAGGPLATREVATICEVSDAEAREQLARVAIERPVGRDGFWSLPTGGSRP